MNNLENSAILKELQEIKNNKDDRDNIYLNLAVKNRNDNNHSPILCEISQKFPSIMDEQDEYNVAVSFFALKFRPPLFIVSIKEGNNNNKDLTNYGVAYLYSGTAYKSPVLYSPEITTGYQSKIHTPVAPSNNNGQMDLRGTYYYVYSIHSFLDRVNLASTTAYNLLPAPAKASHTQPVLFYYDENTRLINAIAQYAYKYDSTTVNFFINNPLRNVMDNFKGLQHDVNNADFMDFEILWDYNSILNNIAWSPQGKAIPDPTTTAPVYLKNVQAYPCTSLFQNIRGIVIKSAGLSVKPQYLPTADRTNLISTSNINDFNPNRSAILTFHEILYTDSMDRSDTLYFNADILNFINLTGGSHLNSIQLNFEMVCCDGRTVPLYLDYNGYADVKLVFKRNRR